MVRHITLTAAAAFVGLAMSASTAAAGDLPQRIVEQQRALQTPANAARTHGDGPERVGKARRAHGQNTVTIGELRRVFTEPSRDAEVAALIGK